MAVNSGNWARVICTNVNEQKGKIRVTIGNTEQRTPKKVTIYAVKNYDSNTKANNVQTRNDDGLVKMYEWEFSELVTTPTWYEIIN